MGRNVRTGKYDRRQKIRDADFASVYSDFVANMIRARVGLALSTYARFSGVDVLKLLDR